MGEDLKMDQPFNAVPIIDGFVKSPDAALRFIPRRCGVRQSTHSSGFARLACRLFYEAVPNSRFLRLFTRASLFIFEILGVEAGISPITGMPPRRFVEV